MLNHRPSCVLPSTCPCPARVPAGLIDYTEFCEILQVDASPQVERLFQMFDKDKSGQIDVKEFLIGLSNFTGAGKEEKLKFAFMVGVSLGPCSPPPPSSSFLLPPHALSLSLGGTSTCLPSPGSIMHCVACL